jgi:O-antigen/teichoic acid export membrane protein
LLAFLIIILAESLGLWFVNNKLAISIERKSAALWVYQFAIVNFLLVIMNSPYMALIFAHEEMDIYAYISILEVVLKLMILFILRFVSWDKLQFYGFLLCVVTLINTIFYRVICRKKYKECQFHICWNKNMLKEIISYTGWNLFGEIAGVFKKQTTSILLNQFFNPVVVASRSIASSVQIAAASFSQNFFAAVRPQIIKKYASGQKKEMLLLMFQSAKGSYFLMYLITLPLIIEMPFILSIWLGSLPEHLIVFTRLVLFDVLIDSVNYPLVTAAQATGKIKLYQIVIGCISMLNLPISWFVLSQGAPAYSVMLIAIGVTCITSIARYIIVKRLICFSGASFLKKVLLPVFGVSILSAVFPLLLALLLNNAKNILQLCLTVSFSVISTGICVYFIGLNMEERRKIRISLKNFLKQKKDLG